LRPWSRIRTTLGEEELKRPLVVGVRCAEIMLLKEGSPSRGAGHCEGQCIPLRFSARYPESVPRPTLPHHYRRVVTAGSCRLVARPSRSRQRAVLGTIREVHAYLQHVRRQEIRTRFVRHSLRHVRVLLNPVAQVVAVDEEGEKVIQRTSRTFRLRAASVDGLYALKPKLNALPLIGPRAQRWAGLLGHAPRVGRQRPLAEPWPRC
jgi:hypothetical protein